MIRKPFLFFLFVLISVKSVSQQKLQHLQNFDKHLLHYGFYLGLNNNGMKLSYQPSTVNNPRIDVQTQAGFNVGLIADLRIIDNVNLRLEPGLMSNTKKLNYNYLTTKQDSVREISSTFLHFPVLLKVSTNRWHNIRPYIIGGVSYDYNFSSNEKNGDDNAAGEFRSKTHNFMYEVGMGIDIYLPFFKFSPSIRGVFALNNELVYDKDTNSPWTSPIGFLGTRGVFLHLAFE